MPWGWDPNAGRYRDSVSGKFMSRGEVLGYVNDMIVFNENKASTLAFLVGEGQLSPTDWKNQMRERVKSEYITQYMLGKGGLDNMQQSDWGKVGAMLKTQYKYLDGFQKDIMEKDLSTAQIAYRSNLYMTASREAYEKAHGQVAKDAGADEERWVLEAEAQHCDDCPAYEDEGWQPIGTFPDPGDGSTACGTNCKCHKEYRNSKTATELE